MKIKLSKSQWETIGNKTGWIKSAMITDFDDPYCPKCRSRLFPADEEYMKAAGVCGDCVAYDKSPDHRYRMKYLAYLEQQKNPTKKDPVVTAQVQAPTKTPTTRPTTRPSPTTTPSPTPRPNSPAKPFQPPQPKVNPDPKARKNDKKIR